MAHNAIFHVGVKAIVTNRDGSILLLKSGKKVPNVLRQKQQFWDFPGGKMAVGEHPEAALIREVKEELGKTIRIDTLVDVVLSNFYDEKRRLHLLLVIYRASLRRPDSVRLSDEHAAWEFVPVREAQRRLAFKYPKSFLRKLGTIGQS